MNTRTICKGCHRLRPVNSARYCASCDAGRRAEEKRRPAATETAARASAEATTEPAPPPSAPAASAETYQAPNILPFVLPEIEEPPQEAS